MIRLLMILLLASPLAAADWPAAEISVGPSLIRISGEDLLGGQIGLTVNRWQNVSLVGSFGFHDGNLGFLEVPEMPRERSKQRCDDDYNGDCDRKPPAPVFVSTGIGDVYTYMGGLRIRKKLFGRLSGFAQGQAGGARVGDDNGFGLAAGGGAQVSITQRFAVEARVEYVRLRIGGSYVGDNLQATVGMVVRFGPWWGGFRKP